MQRHGRQGELKDHPGWWKLDGRTEGKSEYWSVVWKPDGTYWEVASTDIFPLSAGTLKVGLGDQISDPKTVAECEEIPPQLDSRQESFEFSANFARTLRGC
jgi:hypothetical protein